jgi:phospholipid/cholesterol/gamma-HCH transport system substrate-binding protein
MQSNATRDLWVGLFVLAGFVALGYLSLQVGGLEIGRGDRMVLRATFDNIGGLSVRAPVRIAGVKIGHRFRRGDSHGGSAGRSVHLGRAGCGG